MKTVRGPDTVSGEASTLPTALYNFIWSTQAAETTVWKQFDIVSIPNLNLDWVSGKPTAELTSNANLHLRKKKKLNSSVQQHHSTLLRHFAS